MIAFEKLYFEINIKIDLVLEVYYKKLYFYISNSISHIFLLIITGILGIDKIQSWVLIILRSIQENLIVPVHTYTHK